MACAAASALGSAWRCAGRVPGSSAWYRAGRAGRAGGLDRSADPGAPKLRRRAQRRTELGWHGLFDQRGPLVLALDCIGSLSHRTPGPCALSSARSRADRLGGPTLAFELSRSPGPSGRRMWPVPWFHENAVILADVADDHRIDDAARRAGGETRVCRCDDCDPRFRGCAQLWPGEH